MILAEREDKIIWLQTEYRHKDMVKLVPGARWDAARGSWRAPLAWTTCKQLRGVFGTDLTLGPALTQWGWDEWNLRVSPALELRALTDLYGDPDLFPFQRAGVQFLLTAGDALLADEMGTGKTVQAAVALRTMHDQGVTNPFPALVVCPNSVKAVWRRELEKWIPGVRVTVLGGGAQVRKKGLTGDFDVAVINWEAAWRDSRLAPYGNVRLTEADRKEGLLNKFPWGVVIADEAHRMKNPKAKQTRAVWWLGKNAAFRWALTGTPIANAPDDLWSILHFLAPEEWPSRTAYVDRYCLVSWNPYGGLDVVGVRPDTSKEFYDCLDPRMRRMPKELVLPFLPPKLRSVRYAEMTPKQAKAYREMDKHMVAQLGEDGIIAETLPIVQKMRLMQFSSASAYQDEEGTVQLALPSNKIETMIEVLEELGDLPLVIFAQSRKLILLAAHRLFELRIPHRVIVGGVSTDEREVAVKDFQEGRARVILLTAQAGGEGLTLTRASHVLFLQRSWSMLANKQAEDRVHRIGSEVHESIHVIDLIAPGTVEEGQVEALHAKFERLQQIVRDRETVRAAGDLAALQRLDLEEAAIMGSEL